MNMCPPITQEFYLYYFTAWFFFMWILLIILEKNAIVDKELALRAIEDLENGIA
jgi:hypothetical protein